MTRHATIPSERSLLDDTAVRAFLTDVMDLEPAAARVQSLGGGVSSVVVRVTTDEGCTVIKQALPRLRVEATWLARLERSGIEARCARLGTFQRDLRTRSSRTSRWGRGLARSRWGPSPARRASPSGTSSCESSSNLGQGRTQTRRPSQAVDRLVRRKG